MWDGRRRRWTGPITGGNQKDGLAFAFVRDSIGTEAVQTVNQPMPNGARVPGYAESKQTGSTDDDNRVCGLTSQVLLSSVHELYVTL